MAKPLQYSGGGAANDPSAALLTEPDAFEAGFELEIAWQSSLTVQLPASPVALCRTIQSEPAREARRTIHCQFIVPLAAASKLRPTA